MGQGELLLAGKSKWAEPLPDACPPPEAWEPNNEVYYRLVDGHPPTMEDFHSTRKRQPHRQIRNATECEARSVSVYDDIEECRTTARTFPALRHKQLAKVTLSPGSGKVLQTMKNPSHHSWWLKAAFDPVSICETI